MGKVLPLHLQPLCSNTAVAVFLIFFLKWASMYIKFHLLKKILLQKKKKDLIF